MHQELLARLLSWQKNRQPAEYLLAFSGGRDSTALLHMLAQIRSVLSVPLRACYIHHGWSEQADDWSEFCRLQAQHYNIPYVERKLQLSATAGVGKGGPEAQARNGRYRALGDILKPGGVLLTAHHLNDQSETFLLQLLRGSGIDGLASMPVTRTFAAGEHWRPLLTRTREEINQYILAHNINYIDDPSNDDTYYQRNFIRHEIMPMLYKRFPAADTLIARSARWLGESQLLQQQLLDRYLGQNISDVLSWYDYKQQSYGEITEKALIRRWLQRLGCPPPPAKRLQNLWSQLQQTTPGHAEIRYCDLVIIHYRGRLFLYRETNPEPPPVFALHTQWSGIGNLTVMLPTAYDASQLCWQNYPCSGKMQLPNQQYATSLQHIFQQRGIPPYLRRRLPILSNHREVLWVGLLGYSKQAQNMRIVWQKKAHSVSIPQN